MRLLCRARTKALAAIREQARAVFEKPRPAWAQGRSLAVHLRCARWRKIPFVSVADDVDVTEVPNTCPPPCDRQRASSW